MALGTSQHTHTEEKNDSENERNIENMHWTDNKRTSEKTSNSALCTYDFFHVRCERATINLDYV